MSTKFITNIASTILFVSSIGSATASIPVLQLNTNISMDNGYEIYLALNDNEQGVFFGSGNNWGQTFSDTITLNHGTDYYLHVLGYDQGGIAGFLGEFSLNSIDHVFSNNTTSLTTNTIDWKANNEGWGQNYLTSLTNLGSNGVGPWGSRPSIASTATWIWAGDANAKDTAYFSTKISSLSSVPIPGAVWLFVSGLGILGMKVRRKNFSA